jgi:hypothetical protein
LLIPVVFGENEKDAILRPENTSCIAIRCRPRGECVVRVEDHIRLGPEGVGFFDDERAHPYIALQFEYPRNSPGVHRARHDDAGIFQIPRYSFIVQGATPDTFAAITPGNEPDFKRLLSRRIAVGEYRNFDIGSCNWIAEEDRDSEELEGGFVQA